MTKKLVKIFRKHNIETKNPYETTKNNVLITSNVLLSYKEKLVFAETQVIE